MAARVAASQTAAPLCLISAQILKPELFKTVPDKIFSNNLIWDQAEARGQVVRRGT